MTKFRGNIFLLFVLLAAISVEYVPKTDYYKEFNQASWNVVRGCYKLSIDTRLEFVKFSETLRLGYAVYDPENNKVDTLMYNTSHKAKVGFLKVLKPNLVPIECPHGLYANKRFKDDLVKLGLWSMFKEAVIE